MSNSNVAIANNNPFGFTYNQHALGVNNYFPPSLLQPATTEHSAIYQQPPCKDLPCGGETIASFSENLAKQCPELEKPLWQHTWQQQCITKGPDVCLQVFIEKLLSACPDVAFHSMKDKLIPYLKDKISTAESTIPDCYHKDYCHIMDKTAVHSRERIAANAIHSKGNIAYQIKDFLFPPEWTNVQEFLRLRKDDFREKFLYLAAEHDHNGALNPSLVAGILTKLSENFDLKYKVVKTYDEVCNTIEEAAKIGKVTNVIISGHGSPSGIELGNQLHGRISRKNEFTTCFSKLEPYAKIILFSCSTGALPPQEIKKLDNIAQTIADKSKRVVIAPNQAVWPALTNLLPTNSTMLHCPRHGNLHMILSAYMPFYSYLPFYSANAFLVFNPSYSECPRYKKKEGDSTEISMAETIKKDLMEKFLLPKESEKNFHDEDFLVFCKDDPRDKVSFLAGDYCLRPWNPENAASTLGFLADKFDIKYKLLFSNDQIKSRDTICKEIDDTSTYGKVAALFIEAPADSNGNLILSERKLGTVVEKLTEESFSECFSKLDKDAPIFLFPTHGEEEQNKIKSAEIISRLANRVVVIGKCPADEQSIKIPSESSQMEPVTYAFLKNYVENNCPTNDNSFFNKFEPTDQNSIINLIANFFSLN